MASNEDKRRMTPIMDRPFKPDLPGACLSRIQTGTLQLRYKGLRFCKNPFDQAIYLRLIQQLKPASIIEIGTSEGGSALWFQDQCSALGMTTRIVSIDLEPPAIDREGVMFMAGDAARPDSTFPHQLIADLPHPWLVSEDSAHTFETCSAVLSYFHRRLVSGDYIVIEDGIVADLPEAKYRRYLDGPNRAITEFLRRNPDEFSVDSELCDLFGYNVTFNPNGWIKAL